MHVVEPQPKRRGPVQKLPSYDVKIVAGRRIVVYHDQDNNNKKEEEDSNKKKKEEEKADHNHR